LKEVDAKLEHFFDAMGR